MTKLIAYFSATGVTKKVAEKIAEIDNDDIYEIVPETKYTDADLNWQDENSRTTVEKNDKSIRPKISSSVDTSKYDTIVLGFPVWWYTYPSIIASFLDDNNLDGKTVIPFVTSGGSSITDSENNLKNDYPEINWKPGKRLSSSSSSSELEDLINQ